MLSETLIKTILKTIDVEAIQSRALADPRVREALDLAGSIRDDFANIKMVQAEILSRLDLLTQAIDYLASNMPVKKIAQPKPEKEIS